MKKKYLDSYIQKISDTHILKKIDQIFQPLAKLSITKVFLLIIEPNDDMKTLIYLKAIDVGLIPILVPSAWGAYRQNEYMSHFSDVYLIENQIFSVLGNPKLAPRKLWNTYGVFSSGSTGRPELSFLSVAGAIKNAQAHAESMDISNHSTVIKVLPLDHAFGIIAYVWTIIYSGASLLSLNQFCGWADLKKHNKTNSIIHLTPTWVHFLLNNNEDSIRLKCNVSIGSSTIENKYIEQFRCYCQAKIYITYGLTEAGPRVSTGQWSIDKNLPDYYYIGKAIKSTELRILNEDRKIKKTGKGLLIVKSPSIRKNTKTEDFFKSYLITKDHVYLDHQKNIFLKYDHTEKFKFRDYLLDLNQISKVINSPCIALSWINKKREFWGLIYVNEKQQKNKILKIINLKCHPNILVRTMAMPSGNLNKIDIEACCQLLRIELDKSVKIFYSSFV